MNKLRYMLETPSIRRYSLMSHPPKRMRHEQ
jgi:hypothetical protein